MLVIPSSTSQHDQKFVVMAPRCSCPIKQSWSRESWSRGKLISWHRVLCTYLHKWLPWPMRYQRQQQECGQYEKSHWNIRLILEYSQFQTPPCFTILISSQLKVPLTIIVLRQFVIPYVHLYEHKKLTRENFVTRNILTWSALQYIQYFNKYHV